MRYLGRVFFMFTALAGLAGIAPNALAAKMTHGPMLGAQGSDTMSVWARSDVPAKLSVRYWSEDGTVRISDPVETTLLHDLTGVVRLAKLKPATLYQYQVMVDGNAQAPGGTFKTLADPAALVDEKLNPRGLFNLRFEFACGNNQNPNGGLGPSLPTYDTLLAQERKKVDFAILNGDWLYEENRDYPLSSWQGQVGLGPDDGALVPDRLQHAPTLTGVWENYKTYMARASNLMEWHRHVPTYYTFDDHELLNDIYASAEPGFRNRRAVFRDIGVQGWFDYLGWSNPLVTTQGVHFGTAALEKGSNILTDPNADFTKINFAEAGTLHVHWGTADFAVKDLPVPPSSPDDYDPDYNGGDPNARVYRIVKVLDKNRLQLSHKAAATRASHYSIGRHSYGDFKVSNCHFFMCDTRTHRSLHSIKEPAKRGVTMLGATQRDWLVDEMKASDADFFFIASSVNFMIPHVGGGGHAFEAATKDDAWTSFLEEREYLIKVFESLGKPVFIMTGDLHNSFAVKISDQVWEFASGPHNSVNHRPVDEGNRPVNGKYRYGPRECEIRWSTVAMEDIPRSARMFPHYCVVQVNNVFNNPLERGGTRSVAYPHPQVIFQFYNGLTGDLAYAESISTKMDKVTITPMPGSKPVNKPVEESVAP